MVICIFCGKENIDGNRFCYNCGKPLKLVKTIPVLKASSFMIKPPPRVIAGVGMCHYHPNLPARYICARCGRAICKYCAKPYGALVFCPECFSRIGFIQPAPVYPPSLTFQQPPASFL
jgi:DNA-directed RNA polymerase subunit RPC12/RpoP